MKKTISFWLSNARHRALMQSVLPAILATCMAWQSPDFSLPLALVAILGIIFGHLSMNLFDDYFDYKVKKSTYRDELSHKGFRARIAKCHYITSGEATINQLLIASLLFGALAVACGFTIWLHRGNIILIFALLTGILGVCYSGPPLRLSYHGLGELLIGFMFGPLLMGGVYYSACGAFSLGVLLVSIVVGLLVANILYVHSIMDYEPDKEVGKITFAVLLNNKKLMLISLFILLLSVFGLIIAGVITGHLSVYYLFVLLLLPMAGSLFYLMVEFVRDPKRNFNPSLWMGPMPRWDKITAMGIDWFMIRWLLARNLLSFFCLIFIIINFVA